MPFCKEPHKSNKSALFHARFYSHGGGSQPPWAACYT